MAADHRDLHSGHAHGRLSDSVIGVVFQRDPRYKASQSTPSDRIGTNFDDDANSVVLPLSRGPTPYSRQSPAIKKALHQEANRRCQTRFRAQQRNLEQELERQVQHLRQEVQVMKLKRSTRNVPGRTKPSSWVIVGELLQSLDAQFQATFTYDEPKNDANARSTFLRTVLSPGEGQDFDALLSQQRRFALYFKDPQLELERVEAVSPSVMRARAKLSVTVSEFTLKNLFPADGVTLRARLLDQRLDCRWGLTLLLDDSGCVERLESSIDLLSPLIRVLGVEDSIRILSEALE